MDNTEARIKYLTEELHKAQMEINRLVLENQEQDFEIHKLGKQRDELFERLVMNKDHIDKDAEELHETAKQIIFGSPEERHEASERAAKNAAMIKRAMEEATKKLEEEGLASVEDIREGILVMLGV